MACARAVFEDCAERRGEIVQLHAQALLDTAQDVDYSRERLYDVSARPSEDDLTIGQLSEDHGWIQGFAAMAPSSLTALFG